MDKNIKILVVDDFATMRKIIKKLLQGLGYVDVEEAENGKTALNLLTKFPFDFLITDWNMPVMTGIELLKEIRKNEKLISLPVLMVTAEAKREQIVEAANADVNGYIVKPFTGAKLQEKVDMIFDRINAEKGK